MSSGAHDWVSDDIKVGSNAGRTNCQHLRPESTWRPGTAMKYDVENSVSTINASGIHRS